MEELNQNIP